MLFLSVRPNLFLVHITLIYCRGHITGCRPLFSCSVWFVFCVLVCFGCVFLFCCSVFVLRRNCDGRTMYRSTTSLLLRPLISRRLHSSLQHAIERVERPGESQEASAEKNVVRVRLLLCCITTVQSTHRHLAAMPMQQPHQQGGRKAHYTKGSSGRFNVLNLDLCGRELVVSPAPPSLRRPLGRPF